MFSSNFLRGDLWKSKISQFNENDIVIPPFVYFDDKTGNVLGPHSGIHKLGAVYVSIPFLPEECLSTLDNLFLF
jgi:hypothetical protein